MKHLLLLVLLTTFSLTVSKVTAQPDRQDTELITAVRGKNLEKTKQLLAKGVDVNGENYYGETAIEVAIKSNQLEMVRYLITQGASDRWGVEHAAANNNLPMVRLLIEHDFSLGESIVFAAEHNNMEMVRVLVNAGSEVNISQKRKSGIFKKYYVTPIEFAVMHDNATMVTFLIDHGVSSENAIREALIAGKEDLARILIDRDGNYTNWLTAAFEYKNRTLIDYLVSKGADMHVRDKEGNSLLHLSCLDGNYDLVAYCLETHKLDVNDVNFKKETPLMLAVSSGNNTLVSYLLQHGANARLLNNQMENALFYVKDSGIETFELLKGHGADISQKNISQQTLLINAARNKNYEVTHFLLENGANIHVKDDQGHTAFQYVISPYDRNDVLIQLFLERGADINTQDASEGKSLMFYAIEREQIARVKELHAMGASVNVLDNEGERPRTDDPELIHFLVDNGADINARDSRDDTYLCVAISQKDFELIHYLVSKGIDVNQNCYFSEPALVKAIESDNLTAVEFLVDNGANVNAVGYFEKTMVEYAREHGNPEIVKVLEAKGAMSKEDRNELFRKSMEMERKLRAAMSANNPEQLVGLIKQCPGLIIQDKIVKEMGVYAAENGNPVIAELLITQMKLDINEAVNPSGQNMLMVATLRDQTSLVSFLIHRGCNLQITDTSGKRAHDYASSKTMKKIYKEAGW